MKPVKAMLILLTAITLFYTPINIQAKTHKTYSSQLTKQERRMEKKLLKKLKKNPNLNGFYIKKVYKKKTTLPKMYKRAIKNLRRLNRVYTAITLDYPEYYWISGDSSFSFSYSVKRYNLKLLFNKNLPHSKKIVKKFNKRINQIVKEIKKDKPKTSEDKVIAINKWLCKNINYELSGKSAYTAYGAALNKKAVCDGVASIFKILCKNFHVPCLKVRGTATLKSGVRENHAWNLVYVNSKWLGVDSTWNISTKCENYALLQKKEEFTKIHHKIPENGKIEGFYLNNKRFLYKTLKSAF